jgi:putative membrane protein
MMGFYGGWALFGGIIFVLFWVAVIFLIVWAIRKSGRYTGMDTQNRTALDIAKERYAKGEITKEQFDQIKKDLSSS